MHTVRHPVCRKILGLQDTGIIVVFIRYGKGADDLSAMSIIPHCIPNRCAFTKTGVINRLIHESPYTLWIPGTVITHDFIIRQRIGPEHCIVTVQHKFRPVSILNQSCWIVDYNLPARFSVFQDKESLYPICLRKTSFPTSA